MTDDKLEEFYIQTENFSKKIVDKLNLDDIINNCDTFLSSLTNKGDKNFSKDDSPNKIVNTNSVSFSHQDLIDNEELARLVK